ncbi:MAG: alpha/beta hydrolase family protein [Micromonosporaceae bacterium]
MTSREVLTRPAPPPDAVLRYGGGKDQIADLRLPHRQSASSADGVTDPAPIVVLIHGGFWRDEYDRAHLGPRAAALAARGYAVCVPEFHRSSPGHSGWPDTFGDVATAADTLPGMMTEAAGAGAVDPEHVLLAGHSAGGHLALWAAARHRLPADAPWRTQAPPAVRGVIALAAVSDLVACHDQGMGDGAAAALMGGPPELVPDRFAAADPAGLLPLGRPVWLIHGTDDMNVPVGMSRAFAARARAAGDDAELRELSGCDHFNLIDPLSDAWPQVLAVFADAALR